MLVSLDSEAIQAELQRLIYAEIARRMGGIGVSSFDGADSYNPSHRPAEWFRTRLSNRVRLTSTGSMSFNESTGTITVSITYTPIPITSET